jgi:photosystem II stability/assembly factor-like uncharacterized protein
MPIVPAIDGRLTFFDVRHGWLLTTAQSTDGLNVTSTLWRTANGGASWASIYAYTYRVDVHPSSVPGGCYWQDSIAWTSLTHGIVGVACPFDAQPAVDVTDDGGATWTRHVLPALPQREGIALFSNVGQVRAFGRHLVASVSRCVGPNGTSCTPYFEIYSSADGGASWTSGAIFRGGNDPLVSIDAEHSWTVGCIDEACATVGLLATTDGGLRWNLYPIRTEMGPNMHGSRLYSFMTAELGVVSVSNELVPRWAYFRTTDGGRTYVAFQPVLES